MTIETTTQASGATGSVITLNRVFKLGSITLADPDRTLPPEEALRLYAPNYPILSAADLGEPYVEGDQLVYPVRKPEVKTKG